MPNAAPARACAISPARKWRPSGDKNFRLVVRDERVGFRLPVDQRLMQMPAAGERVGKFRPAHEADQMAVPPRHLLHRRAEQHHGVGGGETQLRREGEFVLARPQLDLQRAQRHAEPEHGLAQHVHDRADLIEAVLGQVLEALRGEGHLRRLRRPVRDHVRRELRVLDLEQMEFDLEPGAIVEARLAELAERVAIELPGRERHRPAVGEDDVAQHPAGVGRPRQHAERRRIGDHDEIAGALHLRHVQARRRR